MDLEYTFLIQHTRDENLVRNYYLGSIFTFLAVFYVHVNPAPFQGNKARARG